MVTCLSLVGDGLPGSYSSNLARRMAAVPQSGQVPLWEVSPDRRRETRVCLSIEFHLPGKCRSIPYDQKASRREVTVPQTLFNGTRPACNFRPTSLGFEQSGNTEI